MSKKGDICKHCGKGTLFLWGDCSNCSRVTVTMIPCEVTPKPLKVPKTTLFFLEYKDVLSYNKCECGAEKANTTHSRWCQKYVR